MNLFINEELIGGKKTKKQVYKYNIDELNKYFNSIETNNQTKINICCYRIVHSNKYKKVPFPFLQYMLYKYPYSDRQHHVMCFPFEKISGKNIIKQVRNLLKNF